MTLLPGKSMDIVEEVSTALPNPTRYEIGTEAANSYSVLPIPIMLIGSSSAWSAWTPRSYAIV